MYGVKVENAAAAREELLNPELHSGLGVARSCPAHQASPEFIGFRVLHGRAVCPVCGGDAGSAVSGGRVAPSAVRHSIGGQWLSSVDAAEGRGPTGW